MNATAPAPVSADETRETIRRAFADDGVTLDAARAALRHGAEHATTDDGYRYAVRWSHALENVARHGTGGSVRLWARGHDGRPVDVLQVTPSGSVWAPGSRTLDASRATFATLDGSRRDYAGTRVIVSGPHALAFVDAGGALVLWWDGVDL